MVVPGTQKRNARVNGTIHRALGKYDNAVRVNTQRARWFAVAVAGADYRLLIFVHLRLTIVLAGFIIFPLTNAKLFFPRRNITDNGSILYAFCFRGVYRLIPLLSITDLQDKAGIAVDEVAAVCILDEWHSTLKQLVGGLLPRSARFIIGAFFENLRRSLPALIEYAIDASSCRCIALIGIAEHLGGDFFRVATFDIQSGVLLVYVYTAKLPALPLDEPVIVRHSLLNIGVYRL